MKVLKPFTCKVTHKRYEAGSDYDGARGDELAAKGFVELPEGVAEPLNKLRNLIDGGLTVEKEKQEQTHIKKHEIEVEPTKKRTRRK